MNYSTYQLAIFDFCKNGTGNGAGIAVAGSGKTTTAVDSMAHINRMHDVCFSSFGKDIAAELRKRTNHLPNVEIATYNAFGWKLCCEQLPSRPKLETETEGEGKTEKTLRYGLLNNLMNDEDKTRYYKYRHLIKKIISLFKGRICLDKDAAHTEYPLLVEHHGLDVPTEPWFTDLLLDCYDFCINNASTFDFDDQKFMPIKLGLSIPQFDFMIIDEYQDTNRLEAALMMRACENGRKLVIGDPMQTIYGFRDARLDNMDKFIAEMNAKTLPLSVCYRCPKSVVAEAKKIVPYIEPWEKAEEGVVDTVKKAFCFANVHDQDFVICRTTVHLMRFVINMVRSGRSAFIKGKDIGQNLIRFIDTVKENEYMPIEMFYQNLEAETMSRIEHYKKLDKSGLVGLMQDQLEMVNTLVTEVKSVGQLKAKVKEIFKDQGYGIACMTIHKSKGLQSPPGRNVWFLRPDLLPHPLAKKEWQQQEEVNLKYVGITRTQHGLFFVEKDRDER